MDKNLQSQIEDMLSNRSPECSNPDCMGGLLQRSGSPCGDCEAGKQKRADQERESGEHRGRRMVALMQKRIPLRYTVIGLLEIETEQSEIALDYVSGALLEENLYLFGPYGTGKTQLACSAAMHLIEDGKDCRFISFSRLLRKICDCYSSGESAADLISEYAETSYLILDDVGSSDAFRDESDHTKRVMFEIIDERYGNTLPTIITSNLNVDEFRLAIGDRVSSRLFESCKVVEMDQQYRSN